RLRYVNRQRGAGTRLLLDYELEQRGISASTIAGYEHEEYTHLGVASAVASGIADCGLGVRSAAIALKLGFVPVGWERYDLAIPTVHLPHPGVEAIIAVLKDSEFHKGLGAQPGYRTQQTGTLQYSV